MAYTTTDNVACTYRIDYLDLEGGKLNLQPGAQLWTVDNHPVPIPYGWEQLLLPTTNVQQRRRKSLIDFKKKKRLKEQQQAHIRWEGVQAMAHGMQCRVRDQHQRPPTMKQHWGEAKEKAKEGF